MSAGKLQAKVEAAARKEITWFRDAARLPENQGAFTFLGEGVIERIAERMRVPVSRVRPIVNAVLEEDKDVTVAWTKGNGLPVYRISATANR